MSSIAPTGADKNEGLAENSSLSDVVRNRGLIMRFLVGASATSLACVFTNPCEVLKTRIQLQGELMAKGEGSRAYNGTLDAIVKTIKYDGVKGLQKGLGLGVAYQALMNGTRLMVHDTLMLKSGNDRHETVVKGSGVFLLKSFLSGAISGGVGATIANPIFLGADSWKVKCRLQSQTSLHIRSPGKEEFHYKSTWDAIKQILKKEGILGFTRGTSAAVPRTGLGSAVQLATYDTCRRISLASGITEGFLTFVLSSLLSGLVVSVSMHPLDTAYTRCLTDTRNTYTGPLDCMLKTIHVEGYRGIYKGWSINFLRIGPHTVFTFLFWEKISQMFSEHGL